MSDLVERLRSRKWEDRQHRELRERAADEIERQSATIAQQAERIAILKSKVERVQSLHTGLLTLAVKRWDELFADRAEWFDECKRLRAALSELVVATDDIDCECSINQRISGHRTRCWKPAFDESLESARAALDTKEES